jgi:hypothetical protein
MSYDAYDQADLVEELLTKKGYTMTHGNGYFTAAVGKKLQDPPIEDGEGPEYDEVLDGFWFSWTNPPGRTDIDTGETANSELAAWSYALEHFFEHAEIETHPVGTSIIDRDLSFYAAEVEEMERRLRFSKPDEQQHWQNCLNTARTVHGCLIAHRDAVAKGLTDGSRETSATADAIIQE